MHGLQEGMDSDSDAVFGLDRFRLDSVEIRFGSDSIRFGLKSCHSIRCPVSRRDVCGSKSGQRIYLFFQYHTN